MFPLDEKTTKEWLRELGCPIPLGAAASTPKAAALVAGKLGGDAVIKALVPIGRRGKAGAVRFVKSAKEAALASQGLIGSTVNGFPVAEVLIEKKEHIVRELFLSFTATARGLEMLVSTKGGVDIEETMATNPEDIYSAEISPIKGVSATLARTQWARAGVRGALLSPLAELTARLCDAFIRADALLLELNPIVEIANGKLCIVGAMMGIDNNALFRHPQWVKENGNASLPNNERERRVALIDRSIGAGECQYVELDGDIGLLVGGGGAGLYQHDLILAMGGRPANHSVTPPTGRDNRKLRAVIDAILDHPGLRGLLVGFNFSQMSRVDIRARTLAEALNEKKIDTRKLPIVLRLFGAGESEARALIAKFPNVHYLPRGASLKDGVRLIVDLLSARSGADTT